MAQYLVTYDLHRERHYGLLYQLMAGWGATRLTESLWMANLLGPAPVIRDLVRASLDYDDSVAVIELKQGTDWATTSISAAANAWLSNYVTPAQDAA